MRRSSSGGVGHDGVDCVVVGVGALRTANELKVPANMAACVAGGDEDREGSGVVESEAREGCQSVCAVRWVGRYGLGWAVGGRVHLRSYSATGTTVCVSRSVYS